MELQVGTVAIETAHGADRGHQLNKFIKSGTINNNYVAVLTLLLRMRQAAIHPALVTKDQAADKDAIEAPLPALTASGKLLDRSADDDDDVDELANALGSLDVKKARTCQVCTEPLPSDRRGNHCVDADIGRASQL